MPVCCTPLCQSSPSITVMAAAERPSIYQAARRIKRRDNSLYNALRSIYRDSVFVAEIAGVWPALPLLANLRCGFWYSPHFDATCYFKSTDGHQNNCSFSTARLNLHVARLAGQKGGCIVVDSTRKGKRFPDSMSKTIPIWACVLNRVIRKLLQRERDCQLASTMPELIGHSKQPTQAHSDLHKPISCRRENDIEMHTNLFGGASPWKLSTGPLDVRGNATSMTSAWMECGNLTKISRRDGTSSS